MSLVFMLWQDLDTLSSLWEIRQEELENTEPCMIYFHYCSVAQSCPTFCDLMDCSMPGFPVPHHLPELAQTHVHGMFSWHCSNYSSVFNVLLERWVFAKVKRIFKKFIADRTIIMYCDSNTFSTIFLKLFFIGGWLIYCIQFLLYSKVSQLDIYTDPLFFRLFSRIGHYTVLSRVPCAMQEVLVDYLS